jgi:hypothetical protein
VDDVICCSKRYTLNSSRKCLQGAQVALCEHAAQDKLNEPSDDDLHCRQQHPSIAGESAEDKWRANEDVDAFASWECAGGDREASAEKKSLNEYQTAGYCKQSPGEKVRFLRLLPSIALAAAEKQRLLEEPLSVSNDEKMDGMLCDERLLLRSFEKRPLMQLEQERRCAEDAEWRSIKAKVNAWCKANGYRDLGLVNTAKATYRGATKFPLHTAVKQKSHDMVRLLIQCGADKAVKNSRGQTPMQLVERMPKGEARDQLMAALRMRPYMGRSKSASLSVYLAQ